MSGEPLSFPRVKKIPSFWGQDILEIVKYDHRVAFIKNVKTVICDVEVWEGPCVAYALLKEKQRNRLVDPPL